MTGETIRELLQPLIGKSGAISMVVTRAGRVGFVSTENEKLTSVEVRPDGLVRLERATGWAVIDPGDVVAVAWTASRKPRPANSCKRDLPAYERVSSASARS